MSAPNSYTTTTLVDNVLLIAHVPLSNNTFTAANLITLAQREIELAILPQIASVMEGYYLTFTDYENNASGLFQIPSQAVGAAIASLQLVIGPAVVPINRLDQAEQFSIQSPTSNSYGYFMLGNTIQVMPAPSTGVVRVWYVRRPNALVSTSAAGQITAIAGDTITVSSLPTTFAVDTVVNLCQDQPPFDVVGVGVIAGVAGTDVTLDAAVDDLAIGDWLCLANQTPVPQIPVEFRPLLEQRVAVKIYELQGYLDKMKAAGERLTAMEAAVFGLISPRNASQTKIVNPQNGGFNNSNGKYASVYWSRR